MIADHEAYAAFGDMVSEKAEAERIMLAVLEEPTTATAIIERIADTIG